MLDIRTFQNRPGQVYDPTDLTRLFAEDINAIIDYINNIPPLPVPLIWNDYEYGDYTDWYTAVLYAQYLEIDGQTISETPQNIWRLPTYTELVDASPAGDNPVGGFQDGSYWSGTTYPYSADFAYGVYMIDGYAYLDYKDRPYYLVRCAR